jgi:hypothetical protein
MIDIRNLSIQRDNKYLNTLCVRIKDNSVSLPYKKRSLRGNLTAEHLGGDDFRCTMRVFPNTTGSVSENGECLVRPAYQGLEDELDIRFSIPNRFGYRMDAAKDIEFRDVNGGGDTVTFTFTAPNSNPNTAAAPVEDIDTRVETLMAEIKSLLEAKKAGTQHAKIVKPAKAPKAVKKTRGNVWGTRGLPAGEQAKIRKALRNHSIKEVCELLGYSQMTVRKYGKV